MAHAVLAGSARTRDEHGVRRLSVDGLAAVGVVLIAFLAGIAMHHVLTVISVQRIHVRTHGIDLVPVYNRTMPPRRSGFRPKPLAERWETKVERTDGCWLWRGARDNHGYGKIRSGDGKTLYAHRVAYELFVGAIPEGKQLDHVVCDNKGCVNPSHLAAVPQWENVRRADGWTAARARATHCIHGHEFTPENTIAAGPSRRHRACLTCRREADRRRGARKRAAHGTSALAAASPARP